MTADFEDFVAVQLERAGEQAEDDWLNETGFAALASLREFTSRLAEAIAAGDISETERELLADLLRDDLDRLIAGFAKLRDEARQ